MAFSPDGRTILTGGEDHTARLWDVATGVPLGPRLPHPGPVLSVAFSPDGQYFLAADAARTRLYRAALELPENLDRVSAWLQSLTGLSLDAQQALIQVLDHTAWLEVRQRLHRLGGPPQTTDDPRPAPITRDQEPADRTDLSSILRMFLSRFFAP